MGSGAGLDSLLFWASTLVYNKENSQRVVPPLTLKLHTYGVQHHKCCDPTIEQHKFESFKITVHLCFTIISFQIAQALYEALHPQLHLPHPQNPGPV